MTGGTERMAERRRRIIRGEIRRVAIELFAGRGFDGVTVEDIAAAAGLSPRTFFRYFSSKDDILLHYEQSLQHRVFAAFDAQPDSLGAVAALRAAYVLTSHVTAADRPRMVRLGRILAAAPGLRARVDGQRLAASDVLVERVAERLGVAADASAARTVVLAMSAVAAAEYFAWVDDGGHGDPADRIAAALDLLERGFGSLDSHARRISRRKA